jgi:hypothetical protein
MTQMCDQLSVVSFPSFHISALPSVDLDKLLGSQGMASFARSSELLPVPHPVVQCRVGETKTEGSARPLPINPGLASHLRELYKCSAYKASGDWVFANDAGRPRWQETILQRQLKPAASRAGLGKIGWHTFRHTYSTMLRSAGTDIKVQQELLRHANIQTTDEHLCAGGLGSEACREQQGCRDGASGSEDSTGTDFSEWERNGSRSRFLTTAANSFK